MIWHFKNLWGRRDLVRYFVILNLRIKYKNKLVGFLSGQVDPLLMMLIYALIVILVFRKDFIPFPVITFLALLAWKWLISSISSSATSVSGRSRMIRSIYFPSAILPISNVIAGLFNYLLGLILIIPLFLIFGTRFAANEFWLPLLIIILFLFISGAALICATVCVYLRDIERILRLIFRIFFYLLPIVYFITEQIPKYSIWLDRLNPYALLFNLFENTIAPGLFTYNYMVFAMLAAVLVFFSGYALFVHKDSQFAKLL